MDSPSFKILFDVNGVKKTGDPGDPQYVPDTTYRYTIYDLEKNVFDSINEFNTIYSNYFRCSTELSNNKVPGDNVRTALISTAIIRGCTDISNITLANINVVKTKLKTKIEAFNNAVNNFQSPGNSNDYNPAKVEELLKKYENIINKRNEIDIKMKEINQTDDSHFMDYKGRYDSTQYTNILVTVLATSLIYYIFVKM